MQYQFGTIARIYSSLSIYDDYVLVLEEKLQMYEVRATLDCIEFHEMKN